MHHRHHNHRIKIVPFNQADNDQAIPNNVYPFYKCTQTASLKEFGTLVKLSAHVSVFCHLNMFFWYNDIENVCV